MLDAHRSLTAEDLPQRLIRLGFRADDVTDALAGVRAIVDDGGIPRVQGIAERLLPGIGDLEGRETLAPWDAADVTAAPYPRGLLPMLALVTTAEQVVAWEHARGISCDVAWTSLADLGQQVWVHRMTYGSFGLHTEDWLRLVWSGAFYWLGRLQFNLQRESAGAPSEWVLSTHIPQTGPLTPEVVDASFAYAHRFFARFFPEYPTTDLHCASWLLDPQLVDGLPEHSNMARFGRRWRLYGEPLAGDEDALFFTFHRRGDVDLASLPRGTSLQRLIVDHLQAGRHWHVWHGRCPQPRDREDAAL